MKKAFILIGAYIFASFCGAVTGAAISADSFRMMDVMGFMMMSPLFQFVSLATGFHTKQALPGLQGDFLLDGMTQRHVTR